MMFELWGVFTASLLGSLHCAGMCGGIMLAATEKSMSLYYHFGRGIGYLTLGALAGFFGSGLLRSPHLTAGLYIAVAFFLAFSILLHFKLIDLSRTYVFSNWIFLKIRNWPTPLRSLAVGTTAAILPCGYLYSFVLLSLSSAHWRSGMLVLLFFWLGTVPALWIMNYGRERLANISWLGRYQPYISLFVMVWALYGLLQKGGVSAAAIKGNAANVVQDAKAASTYNEKNQFICH